MMDIDKLEAGRELDALVAEKVMGWREDAYHYWADPGGGDETFWVVAGSTEDHPGNRAWCPSTDISAAWGVVEHVRRMHPARVWFELYAPRGDLPWTAVFFTRCLEWEDSMYEMGSDRIIPSSGKEAPLAICRAALKVVGVK